MARRMNLPLRRAIVQGLVYLCIRWNPQLLPFFYIAFRPDSDDDPQDVDHDYLALSGTEA